MIKFIVYQKQEKHKLVKFFKYELKKGFNEKNF